jgi:hypothetical protein
MRRLVFLILLMAMPSLLTAAMIEGRVVSGDEPLAGVVVTAHASLDFTTEPIARSAANRMSHARAIDMPAPAAAPGSAATTGFGKRCKANDTFF